MAQLILPPLGGITTWTHDAIVTSVSAASTLQFQNTTAATAGVTVQYSPGPELISEAWNTVALASQKSRWIINSQPVSANPISSTIAFSSSENNGSYVQRARIDSAGNIISQGGIFALSGGTGNIRGANFNPGGSSAVVVGTSNTTSLGLGTAGTLTTVNGGLKAAQGFATAYRSAASTVTVAATDCFVGVSGSGARTVNLPAANTLQAGGQITVQDVGNSAGAITINPNGTDNINSVNGAVSIAAAFGRKMFVSDGATNWWVNVTTI